MICLGLTLTYLLIFRYTDLEKNMLIQRTESKSTTRFNDGSCDLKTDF